MPITKPEVWFIPCMGMTTRAVSSRDCRVGKGRTGAVWQPTKKSFHSAASWVTTVLLKTQPVVNGRNPTTVFWNQIKASACWKISDNQLIFNTSGENAVMLLVMECNGYRIEPTGQYTSILPKLSCEIFNPYKTITKNVVGDVLHDWSHFYPV